MLGRRRAPESKLERSVSSLTSGALVDYLKRYVNSAGVAARHFEDTADPIALDTLLENAGAIEVIVRELRSRVKDSDYVPITDSHLQRLVEEFQLRHGGAIPPGAPQST